MSMALRIMACGTQRILMLALRVIRMQIRLEVWMTGRVPQVAVSTLGTILYLGCARNKILYLSLLQKQSTLLLGVSTHNFYG